MNHHRLVASMVYAVALCPSACLSICPSQCRYVVCVWTANAWLEALMYASWKQSQFHQWMSDFNSRCVAVSSHVGDPASVCPAYELDHHVACRRDAFWCLLSLAVTDECLYVRYNSRWSTIPRATVRRAKACMHQTVAVGGMHHCCCRCSWRGSWGRGADGITNETSARWRRTPGLKNDNRKNRIFGSENRISEKNEKLLIWHYYPL